jgi:hypothetical protein
MNLLFMPGSLGSSPHPKSLCLVALNRRGTKACAHRSLRERDFKSGSLLPEGEGLGMRAVNLRTYNDPLALNCQNFRLNTTFGA